MPVINRAKPREMEEEEFDMIRNSINRTLRNYYKGQKQRYRVLPLSYLRLEEDGVHLTDSSYEKLSLAIRRQAINITTSKLRTEGKYRFNETEYNIEFLYQ